MIYVIDANSIAHTHVIFNVSMTKVLLRAYPNSDLAFYSAGSHLAKIAECLSDREKHRIDFHPLSEKEIRKDKLGKIFKTLQNTIADLWLFVQLFSAAQKSNVGKVVILKAHPGSLLMAKYLKKFYPRVQVLAVMHGEIEFLYYANNSWEQSMGSIYRKILRVRAQNFRYVLLNKISKQLLVADGFLEPEEVVEIDHPYPYTNGFSAAVKLELPITIGQVGSVMLRKNAHLIYRLAESHSNDVINGLLRFVTIGPIDEDALPYKNGLVADFTYGDQGAYITRDTFVRELRKINYAVFFYGPEQFILRASGSVLDAIDFNKPIIACRHPFFDYITEKVGNIGFICKDFAEMSETLGLIAKQDIAVLSQYEQQCANLEKFKQMHSIELIANEFKQQVH